MVLKFEQKISSRDAAILRETYLKRTFFANLNDYLLFYNDFRNFLRTFPINKQGWYFRHYEYFLKKTVLRKIGSHAFPQNYLENCENYVLKKSYDACATYSQVEKEFKVDALAFGFGENPMSTGFSFFLEDSKNKNIIFSLSQIYNDWMDEELDYERDEECENMLASGLILDFATYFHNLPSLYEKIYKKMLLSREGLTRYIGKNLYNDFILLFSTNIQINDVPIMDFSKILVKKIFPKRIILESNNKYLKLGSCDHYYFKNRNDNDDKHDGNWGRTLNNIELWLDDSNRLITIVKQAGAPCLGYPYSVDYKGDVFDNFVKNNVSDWVNQIISSTYFANSIFQNFKTKLFLNNI